MLNAQSAAKPRYIPLGRQLISWFVVIAVVPMILISAFAYHHLSTNLSELSEDALLRSARSDVSFIQHWVEDRSLEVSRLASSQRITQYIQAHDPELETPSNSIKEIDTALESLISNLTLGYQHLYDVYVTDRFGNVLFRGVHNDWVTDIVSGKTFHSERIRNIVSMSRTRGGLFYTGLLAKAENLGDGNSFLSASVKGRDGEIIGTVVARINIQPLFKHLTTYLKASVEAFLLDNDLRLNFASALQGDYLDYSPKDWSKAALRDSFDEVAVESFSGVMGGDVFGVRMPVQLFDQTWEYVAQVEKEKLSEPAYEAVKFFSLILLLMASLVAIVAVYVARGIVRPVEELARVSAAVSAGDVSCRAQSQVHNELGAMALALNTMLDVREENERALKESYREAGEALHSLSELKYAIDQHSLVTITDTEGKITFVNERFEEMSGYLSEEVIGNTHRLFNSGVHDRKFWRDFYATLHRGDVWHGEICNKSKSGGLYWVDTTVVPLARDGELHSFIAIRTDITLSKLLEEQLIEAKNAAEAAVATKGEFLASMSHEIRTPMNGVIGMLNLLQRSKLDEVQLRQASIAKQSAESLLTIINDILDFSKIEAGKLELEVLDFNILELLSDFADSMANSVYDKNLNLILDLDGLDRDYVRGDPGRIRQILINLVGNAIKFTSQGEVRIRASLLESYGGRLKFECSIEDTGIGIPEHKLGHLFESFSQVDASTTRKYGGTGLGLTIVKQLCELMGGEIEVSSVHGEGSVFSFGLYFETSTEASLLSAQDNAFAGYSVAVFHPLKTQQEVISKSLRHWGMQARTISGPSDALTELGNTSESFDFLLLDLDASDDPKEVYDFWRGQRCFEDSRIILMPRLGQLSQPKEALSIGYRAVMTQPVSSYRLFDLLQSLLQGADQDVLAQTNGAAADEEDSEVALSKYRKSARLLLVEDNPVNQMVAQALIDQLGLPCDMAGNGVEALEALRNSPEDMPYHVILMDCQMPEMDGYEATQRIRAGDAGQRYQEVPIIAMTANAMKGDEQYCLEIGMNDYISKPVHADVLADKLSKWLGDSSLFLAADMHNVSATTETVDLWDRATALENLGGNEELYAQLLDAAMEDIPSNISNLEASIQSEDFDTARIAAHSIKGVAGSIGATVLVDSAYQAESAAREHSLNDLQQCFPRVLQQFELFKEHLAEHSA